MVKKPTLTADRDCSAFTACEAGVTFQSKAPTEITDRVCKEVTKCANGSVEATKPTLTSDRTCAKKGTKAVRRSQRNLRIHDTCITRTDWLKLPKKGRNFIFCTSRTTNKKTNKQTNRTCTHTIAIFANQARLICTMFEGIERTAFPLRSSNHCSLV